jgi:hypothetical protein
LYPTLSPMGNQGGNGTTLFCLQVVPSTSTSTPTTPWSLPCCWFKTAMQAMWFLPDATSKTRYRCRDAPPGQYSFLARPTRWGPIIMHLQRSMTGGFEAPFFPFFLSPDMFKNLSTPTRPSVPLPHPHMYHTKANMQKVTSVRGVPNCFAI